MIDFGLLALFAVILALVFLAFHAWRGIKADADRIGAFKVEVTNDLNAFRRELVAAMDEAKAAKALAVEVQGTHYKTLLRRIDESEASTLGHTKQVEVLAEKVASLGGRMSALQRWKKDAAEPGDTGGGGEQLEVFPAASVPPPVTMNNGHFGRIVGRKGG